MSQTRLTDVFVRKLKAGSKRQNVMVVRTNGRGTLGVRVTPKGVKTFVVRYKRRQLGIGSVGWDFGEVLAWIESRRGASMAEPS